MRTNYQLLKKKIILGLALGVIAPLSFIALPGNALAASAANSTEQFSLDPVVVTAERQENKELDTPATVTVITHEQIENSGASNVFDILDKQVGFSNISYGPAGRDFGLTSRTVMRGIDKGTLIMVNGAPLNLLNYNGTGNIPLDSIEKIEIIKGSASTLYGSEAIGGVINIITKKAGVKQKPQTAVTSSIGKYDKKWSLEENTDDFNIYVSRDYLGYDSQLSRIYPSTSKNKAYWYGEKGTQDNAFVTANLSDQLTLNWLYSELQDGYGKVPVNGGTDTTVYRYDDVRHSLNFVYNDQPDKLKSILFYNYRDLDGLSGKPGAVQTPSASSSAKMYNFGLDTQKVWKLRNDQDSLIAGLTVSREDYKNKVKTGQHADRTNTSLYSSYSYQVTPKLTTILGVRGQFITDYAKDQNVFVPQFQTLYKINDHTSWYTNIGKSFEMPPLNQYFSYSNGNFSSLKPQQGWTYETGFKVIDGSSSWNISLYHMDIRDKFAWNTANPGQSILMNKGDFRNTGLEVEYRKILNDTWQYTLGAAVSNPQENDSGKWVQDSNRLQLTAGIQYQKEKWFTSLKYLFVGDRENDYYLTQSQVPNRNQLDALVRYKASKDDSIELKMNNLLDRENQLNEYGYIDLPYNWTLTFKHSF